MLRRSRAFFFNCLAPLQAVHAAQSKADALVAVQRLYASRWLGAKADFLHFSPPQHHFVPFYLAAGSVKGVFTATVEYHRTEVDSNGKSSQRTTYIPIQPTVFSSSFSENMSQTYAGYRHDTKHVRVLEGEHVPMMMNDAAEVDLGVADDVNVFEMSDSALSAAVKSSQRARAETDVASMLRTQHVGCSNVQVRFSEFRVTLKKTVPVYVPAFIVSVEYDSTHFKIIVDGVFGHCKGPFLYNPEIIARLAFLGAFVSMAATLNAVAFFNSLTAVFATSSVGATGAYYGAFFASRWYPRFKVDQRRRKQEAQKHNSQSGGGDSNNDNDSGDSGGAKAKTRFGTGSAEGEGAAWSRGMDDRTDRTTCDGKGYYRVLGLQGNESINEVRAAFRRRALSAHPDAGGSDERMCKVNEAYQVLRDPRRRLKYDTGAL